MTSKLHSTQLADDFIGWIRIFGANGTSSVGLGIGLDFETNNFRVSEGDSSPITTCIAIGNKKYKYFVRFGCNPMWRYIQWPHWPSALSGTLLQQRGDPVPCSESHPATVRIG